MPTKLTISVEAYQKKIDRNSKYNSAHTSSVNLRFNHATDADILAYLENVDNKQGLIKELLRARMAEEGFVYTPSEQENN